jgi:energy-coupling factor transporter ATP-binding protein EcfA2
MKQRNAEAVLLTGVYGAGKSTVAAEMAFLMEQRGEPYALLDLDFLIWGGMPGSTALEERQPMLRNAAAGRPEGNGCGHRQRRGHRHRRRGDQQRPASPGRGRPGDDLARLVTTAGRATATSR